MRRLLLPAAALALVLVPALPSFSTMDECYYVQVNLPNGDSPYARVCRPI